ncbi:EcsC family protein [Mobilitalea sibirica]|uniref:EcsC family protein n=1 Tax=Mobilitalea sibirica TaxID=1462919 RepID=A0A8J7H2F9_9FIRM|nr:EcsC family protein [Mobilitalea sibirica]MBH1940964.1 EcsC family protein [Mobilitalea sibirica]
MYIRVTSKEERNKKNVLSKQLKQIEKKEQKILNKKENAFIKTKFNPVIDQIQDKIPKKLQDTLEAAFYKGFQLVFEKGSVYIEKTYNKDKRLMEYEINNYAVDKFCNKRNFKRLDQQAKLSNTLNSSIAVLEGGILGALGIGLPDIPLFIAVIIRSINEIALSYGYQYHTDEEKVYMLHIISGAMKKEMNQKEYDCKIDELGKNIDCNIVTDVNLKDHMKEAADILSDALLTAKFIQGIPIVGVVGGIVNHTIIRKITSYARLKYKKRYLLSRMNKEHS